LPEQEGPAEIQAAEEEESEESAEDDNAIATDDVALKEEKKEQQAVDSGENVPVETVQAPYNKFATTSQVTERSKRNAAVVLSILSSLLLSIGASMQKTINYDSTNPSLFDAIGIIGSVFVLIGVLLGSVV
jgi:hypothetical protein